MPLISDFAKKKKINYFLKGIEKNKKILEVGAGSGWVGEYFRSEGYKNYIGMDINGPADVVGDIKDVHSLPFNEGEFDVVIAFEVIEHVNLVKECFYYLKDEGLLMMTTPLPKMDWLCLLLEKIGLNQKRTSPHDNLTDIKIITGFTTHEYNIMGFISQWGIYKKNGSCCF